MPVQTRRDYEIAPFILNGSPLVREDAIFARIPARTEAIAYGTVCSYNHTTNTWSPFTDENAKDGTGIPAGIVMKEISATAIAAGEVHASVMIGGVVIIDKNQIVFEAGKSLNTVIPLFGMPVEIVLGMQGLYFEATTTGFSRFEN
jgi:hypothetical protein